MRLSYFALTLLVAIPAFAQGYSQYQPPAAVTRMATGCRPTPSLGVVNYPGAENIPHGNNLVLPAGKSIEADGQKLVLSGRILDNRCMPIKDAQIEIWQADPFGKWFLATRADLATPNPVFAGAGRTLSTSTGDFVFYTLFPAAVNKRAPFINIKVKVRGMKELNTQLFFANDSRNGEDAIYNRMKGDASQGVTLNMYPLSGIYGYSGMIDIVMPEKANYVQY